MGDNKNHYYGPPREGRMVPYGSRFSDDEFDNDSIDSGPPPYQGRRNMIEEGPYDRGHERRLQRFDDRPDRDFERERRNFEEQRSIESERRRQYEMRREMELRQSRQIAYQQYPSSEEMSVQSSGRSHSTAMSTGTWDSGRMSDMGSERSEFNPGLGLMGSDTYSDDGRYDPPPRPEYVRPRSPRRGDFYPGYVHPAPGGTVGYDYDSETEEHIPIVDPRRGRGGYGGGYGRGGYGGPRY
ncbi:hypothetical protein Dda_6356 [Drechslerella dactyloides]|uniref:Uncharacterized protein n=1 Tax=Drechslerella dactyloides TaxID=74499 RepID=A0AAD6IX36_DREDA|nr:hypothetical protein Dda_6356 [Drechslerella dactyloides]